MLQATAPHRIGRKSHPVAGRRAIPPFEEVVCGLGVAWRHQNPAMSSAPAPAPHAFALAKIQPPRPRTSLVGRPALELALGTSLLQRRLTLLLAPAGYGKTSALARQIRWLPPGTALAWVSADEDDQLPRFLACLGRALEPHDLPWRVDPDALATLALGERGLRAVADELINALAGAEAARGLLVLDDVHRIADPQVFELLQWVIERLPARWGVAMASRLEPPLAMGRWRAAGELGEFRQYELRFNQDEVVALLAGAGLPADAGVARELLERTDGWAAGLRLNLSARPGGNGARAGVLTQRHLFDYLAAEVLDDMPAELRSFLLCCAVLPELTAARCARVSGSPHAARLLAEVERRGLFVSVLDADELTLRLHDLFRDFLEDRLQRECAGELPALLRRAAEGEDDLPRAVGYLARAGAWDEAAQAVAGRGAELLAIGGGPSLARMLALFPPAEFERRPELHFLRGLSCFPTFAFDTMLAAMQQAEAGFRAAGREAQAWRARAYACLAMENMAQTEVAARELPKLLALPLDDGTRAIVCFGAAWAAYAQARVADVAPWFAQMLQALERVPEPAVWDACFFHSLWVGMPGMDGLLERFGERATALFGDTPTQLRAGVLHARVWLAFSAGRLDEAGHWLARADEDCRWLGRPRSVLTENHLAHTLIDAVGGRRDAAYAAALECRHDIAEHGSAPNRLTHECEAIFTHGRAAWILQDEATLRELDARLAQVPDPCGWAAADDGRRFSRAFVALVDGRLHDAQALLAPLAIDHEPSCFFPAGQATVLLADVRLRLGALDEAAATLRPWIARAMAGGSVGGALLCGWPVLQRLRDTRWGERLSTDQKAVLGRLAATLAPREDPAVRAARPGGAAARAPQDDDAAAPRGGRAQGLAGLSEREREVLARLAAGDSNKLIARGLELSPHTVKRHVANLLGKLGVETRGQAAARWRHGP